MKVYYNDNDKTVCRWLEELISEGLIPDGVVDSRSIAEIDYREVADFDQRHFFAGIGGWAYALQLAGWDESCWTGSCPCQPYSVAGSRKGDADERNLWPEFYRLIQKCRPTTVFGEQVASPDGRLWLSGVRANMEGLGYAFGAADLCAAGVSAPHRRQRLYWLAYADGRDTEAERLQRSRQHGQREEDNRVSRLADSEHPERWPFGIDRQNGCDGADDGRKEAYEQPRTRRQIRRLADSYQLSSDKGGEIGSRGFDRSNEIARSRPGRSSFAGALGDSDKSGSQRRGERFDEYTDQWTPWATGEFIECLDGKSRRIESSSFPLAHGIPARVGRLRGYGNAIVPYLAAEFVASFMDIRDTLDTLD